MQQHNQLTELNIQGRYVEEAVIKRQYTKSKIEK
jgi:hypothetical protein